MKRSTQIRIVAKVLKSSGIRMILQLRCALHSTSFLSNTVSYENCRDQMHLVPYSGEYLWDKVFANAVKVAISAMLSLTQEKIHV